MDTNQVNRKALFLVFLVFVLGIALGAVGTYMVTTHVLAAHSSGGRASVHTMALFTKDLNLTSDQQKQIEAILGDTRTRYAEIRKRDDPEYEKVRQESRDRIRQVLTPEQGPKFEELLLKMDAERLKRSNAGHDRNRR
jgi:Spy/CpxP family protein refolding chaperone